jgi:class 3 adenylate cyclase
MQAMKCPRCQHENLPGQKFCGECGQRLTVACLACGASNPAGQRFCGACGAAVLDPAATSASPESYTPKHLAARILTSRSALEGERKQVTVLFADMKGSMELLADSDPEDARRILDPVLERMMAAVHRFEGTVNQVMGDGIMALFGAPLALEDHALRACYASLRMQEAVQRYSEELRRTNGVEVQIRVGLNSGEVVVRSISSDLRMDYSAVGQTTHLAARMEQLARPGGVLLTAQTWRLVEGRMEVVPQGELQVKGMVEPVATYELKAATGARSRLEAAAARGLTPFIGRDVEMAALSEAAERAAGGRASPESASPGSFSSSRARDCTIGSSSRVTRCRMARTRRTFPSSSSWAAASGSSATMTARRSMNASGRRSGAPASRRCSRRSSPSWGCRSTTRSGSDSTPHRSVAGRWTP